MTNKEKYAILCRNEEGIMLSSRDWWLDALCGLENWEVLLIERQNEIVAAWPYSIKRKFGFDCIVMPEMTVYTSIWLRQIDEDNTTNHWQYKMEIYNELIAMLPKFDYFMLCFYHHLDNWQPFYWHDFEQTTKYTYVIDGIADWDKLFEGFSAARRRKMKKSKALIEVKWGLDPVVFYNHHKLNFEKKRGKMYYSFNDFKRMYDAVKAHNAGEILYVVDTDNNILSAAFIVWEKQSAYLISISNDTSNPDAEASSWIIFESIKFASKYSTRFDFNGNMNKTVEFSHRNFGAVQYPFFQISKNNSRVLRSLQFFRHELHS